MKSSCAVKWILWSTPASKALTAVNYLNGGPGPICLIGQIAQAGANSKTGEWMPLGFRLIAAALFSGMALVGQPLCLSAQETSQGPEIALAKDLPESPIPQLAPAAVEPALAPTVAPFDQQTLAIQDQSPQQPAPPPAPAQNPAAQDSSSSQTPAAQPDSEESKHQKAEEQIRQQEHQRVLGIIPAFNISYLNNAVSLTPSEKVRLAFRSAIDPYTFGIAFIVAGLGESKDDNPGFGWGPLGYAKRSGAAYLDAFDGTMIGNAFLPIILHQDPRYFRLGHGTFRHRFLYALATSFICKHDNTGKWEPNYSNVGGNIISGALSNYYYPASKSGIVQTISDGFTVTFEGTFGATLQEFWPDISRKLFHKDPTHGLDAVAPGPVHGLKQPAKAPAPLIVNATGKSLI